MGKRSRIIAAVKRNPKAFMYKGRWGFEPYPAVIDKSGKVVPLTFWATKRPYMSLVRSVLVGLGYIPKPKKRIVEPV